VATIPPPPPPPSGPVLSTDNENSELTAEKVESPETVIGSKNNTSETDLCNNDVESLLNNEIVKPDSKLKSPEKEVVKKVETTDEAALNKKEKDKELMSQIKERIQRKKEEKLRKEKEEKEKNEKEAFTNKNIQQEKEDNLREKLIQKKLEREKRSESDELENSLDTSRDSFSLDIFATSEERKSRKRKSSESKDNSSNEKNDDNTLKSPAEKENKTIVETNTTCTTETAPKNWRFIDAGYGEDDDDDDDDEEDVDGVHDKDSKEEVQLEVKAKDSNDDTSKTKEENVDNYAEMLLEGIEGT